MFENRVTDIENRLASYKNIGKHTGGRGFFKKVKDLYCSVLFFILKPLLNYQNAYNQAVYEHSLELKGRIDRLERDLKAFRRLEERVGGLEYKLLTGFPPGFDYAKFEDKFRGDEELVKGRQRAYLDYLNREFEVLDIGCGRGEFLEILKEAGFRARGIDSSPQMVARCRAKGLDVEQAEALGYISSRKDNLGNVFLSQVVEHMDYKDIYTLIKSCWQKMAKESLLLIETINPNSFYAQSRAYVIDPTHVGLVSPETLSYTFDKIGFRNLRIIYKSPVPRKDRLALVTQEIGDKRLDRAISKINDDLKKIDDIIFGNLEYAIMGVK